MRADGFLKRLGRRSTWLQSAVGRLRNREAQRYAATFERIRAQIVDESVTIDSPVFGGRFEVGTRSDLLRRLLSPAGFEAALADAVRTNAPRDRDFVDVGANIGLYTVLAATVLDEAQRVLAIEPSVAAQQLLARNLTLNGCGERVILYDGAASAAAGEAVLHSVPGKEEYSSLGEVQHPSVADSTAERGPVLTETVDRLVDRYGLEPGFIKIDVEGAEFMVLEGASATLDRLRPYLLIEVYDQRLIDVSGVSSQRVVEWLTNAGYEVTNAWTGDSQLTFPVDGELLATPRG